MEIIPYKQSLTHSCLTACFLMIAQSHYDIAFDELVEQELSFNGSKRKYPFYVVGIPAEFSKRFDKNITIYADNKYFSKILKDSFLEITTVQVSHGQISIELIIELLDQGPVVCHIDIHALGDYSHSSHFIVIEKSIKDKFLIIDPWIGKRRRLSVSTLTEAVHELKFIVKMCPLLLVISD